MADCTQQYTDCGEIDDLYECAKLLIANSKLFRDWTNGDEDTTVLLGGKPFPSLRAIIQNVNRLANIATLETPGASMPDGKTITVDGLGAFSALGGNLLLNSEAWITESGDWVAPVTGWYELWLIGGGDSGRGSYDANTTRVQGGTGGSVLEKILYLTAGDIIPVTIGAGGQAGGYGGSTSFGEDTTADSMRYLRGSEQTGDGTQAYRALGGGEGGGFGAYDTAENGSGRFYGAGGGAAYIYSGNFVLGHGKQGAIRARWHDPAKANGPAPALLSARRMAPRGSVAPVTVNLYDPATGQGSVWREEDAEAKLAEGLITEEAWQEVCAARAAEERAAWLTSPDTVEERFQMLRSARDSKLSATDYLMAPDYPITAEQKADVMEYRQALRDLPAQPGAPWDGGGLETPWPTMPVIEKDE